MRLIWGVNPVRANREYWGWDWRGQLARISHDTEKSVGTHVV